MAAIELASFSDPWPESAFAELITAAHARAMVAVQAGAEQIVGYCVRIQAADEGEIANIAVVPSARGTGVGALLLDDAIAASEADGVLQLFLEVRTSNDAARRLYTSRGFVPVGRRRAYYQEPLEDALVMRRAIAPAV
jgi:[ribosomal protein S18]-alanine N-acetyltransferase